jgi:hypothetical protein
VIDLAHPLFAEGLVGEAVGGINVDSFSVEVNMNALQFRRTDLLKAGILIEIGGQTFFYVSLYILGEER